MQAKPHYKGRGGLTAKMRARLTSAARCAIRMRSKEPDRKKAVRQLERDLLNGPAHCFGDHRHCSSDFCCKNKTDNTMNVIPTIPDDEDATVDLLRCFIHA